MSARLITGNLDYYSQYTFSRTWKKKYFEFTDDGFLAWYDFHGDRTPNNAVNLREVCQYISVGPYTANVPGRPLPPLKGDDNLLMCFPQNLTLKPNEIHWLYFTDYNQLNQWMSAFVSTFPPPARQPTPPPCLPVPPPCYEPVPPPCAQPLPPPPPPCPQQQPAYYEVQPVCQQTTYCEPPRAAVEYCEQAPVLYETSMQQLPPAAYPPQAPLLQHQSTFIVDPAPPMAEPSPFYMSPSKYTQPAMVMVPSGSSRPSITVQPNGVQPPYAGYPLLSESGPALISAAFNPGANFSNKPFNPSGNGNVVLRYGYGGYAGGRPYFG